MMIRKQCSADCKMAICTIPTSLQYLREMRVIFPRTDQRKIVTDLPAAFGSSPVFIDLVQARYYPALRKYDPFFPWKKISPSKCPRAITFLLEITNKNKLDFGQNRTFT